MVTVDKRGEITTLRKGSGVVTAADKRNQLHTGSAQVRNIILNIPSSDPDKCYLFHSSVCILVKSNPNKNSGEFKSFLTKKSTYKYFMCMGTPCFSRIFTKGNNFCDPLFAFRKNKALPIRGLLLKERICFCRSKFFPLRADPN